MSDDINTILARTREKVRRQRLHRQIGAIDTRLEKLGNPQSTLRKNRIYRLLSKKRRLERELAQPGLFF